MLDRMIAEQAHLVQALTKRLKREKKVLKKLPAAELMGLEAARFPEPR